MDLITTAFRKIYTAFLVMLMVACSTVEDPAVFPALSFANLEPIALGVAHVEIKPAPLSPLQPPNVEHLSPVSFEEAVTGWANRRFSANGVGPTRFVVELNSGSLIERRLAVDSGLRGLLTNEQAIEYEGRIQVTLMALDGGGVVQAEASSEVWQTRTMAENVTPDDRQMLLYEMIETLVQSLDKEIIPEMRQYFGDYVL